MNFKVHVGFGFHVNLYHSFRGDSNDDSGFGSDIRIMRKIIKALDEFNENGIDIRGTWDFENAYSLERILPRHAPDIIEGVKRRVDSGKDEIILMSYNNGLVSCMDDEELEKSIRWAVTNPYGSGAVDVFGKYSPIVRPQEMMFSPSNIFKYSQMGIRGLCLYYSGVPFDAFRTIMPLLPEENAFNPLRYSYKGESITIMPAISHSDLIDYGGLRALVKRLRMMQVCREIKSDVMIFINMDADAMLWSGVDMPLLPRVIPLAGGLKALVRSVADLDYVVFDTLGGYMKSHKPLRDIEFGHDLADGIFDGYASWAEKPLNQMVWTRIERARLAHGKACALIEDIKAKCRVEAAREHIRKGLESKIRLMSTTHFGLAAPMINSQREKEAMRLSEKMETKMSNALEELKSAWIEENKHCIGYGKCPGCRKPVASVMVNMGSNCKFKYTSFRIMLEPGQAVSADELFIMDEEGNKARAAFLEVSRNYDLSLGQVQVFVFSKGIGRMRLDVFAQKELEHLKKYGQEGLVIVDENRLSGEGISVECDGARVSSVEMLGRRIGGEDFFRSYIKYSHSLIHEKHDFDVVVKDIISSADGEVGGYRFKGEISLPGQKRGGSFIQDMFIVRGIRALIIRMEIQYPQTGEKDVMSNEVASLERYYDGRWIEAVPLRIKLQMPKKAKVVKRNYQGDISSYLIDDFERADEKNAFVDSFNNHVSCGFVGLTDGEFGMAIAADRKRLSSMAFCPMRVRGFGADRHVYMNPFGTFYGRQRHHRTYCGGMAQRIMVAASPYHKSLAPSYNGVKSEFMLALFPFEGDVPDGDTLESIRAFCDSDVCMGISGGYNDSGFRESVTLKQEDDFFPERENAYMSLVSGVTLDLKVRFMISMLWKMFRSWFTR